MKRDFQLPEHDFDYLESLGLNWEAIRDQGMNWIVIHNYPIASGYNVDKVSVAIKIESGYPRAPLDMAYFYPALYRKDNQPINALSNQRINNLLFQRWSRHRTPENPWREGIDDLSTHLLLVNFWFEQEFIKIPNGIAA